MGVKYTNNARTTLNGSVTNVATSIVVTDGSVFPAAGGADYFYMTLENAAGTTREIVKVTARSTNTLTVVRGQDGTSATAFANADKAELRLTTALLTDALAEKQDVDVDLASWAAITRAAGFDAFVAAPSSANLRTLITDESGSGALLFADGALGTPSSGTLTNATGLPIAGLVSSTLTALGVGSLELGHASDTTITRVSAGVIAVEGSNVILANQFGVIPTNSAVALTDPNADRLSFWDDSAGAWAWLTLGTGLTITGTTIDAVTGPTVTIETASPSIEVLMRVRRGL